MAIDQSHLNQRMIGDGIERYFRKISGGKGDAAFALPVLRISRQAAADILGGITAVAASRRHPGSKACQAVQFILDVGASAAAVITTEILVSMASQPSPSKRKVGGALARHLVNELRFRRLQDENPGLAKILRDLQVGRSRSSYQHKISKHLRGLESPVDPEIAFMGSYILLEIARQMTGFFEFKTFVENAGTGKPTKRTVLEWSEDAIEWIDKAHLHFSKLSPVFLPMVDKPHPWDEEGLVGGYIGDSSLLRPAVSQRNAMRRRGEVRLPAPVVSALNALQEVPWRVNERLRRILDHYWENSISVGDLVRREPDEVPEMTEEIRSDATARKEWRFAARRVHEKNAALLSSKIAFQRALSTSKLFETGQRIYFPHFLDFRGRLYPRPVGLHPQAEEHVRALLEFAEGRECLDPYWLRIEGANRWGLDKVSYAERVRWVLGNEEWILAVAEDPYSNRQWEDADKPWMFLAWCFAYSDWMRGDTCVHLPCYTDGSNNGLQIYSLLLRDPDSGASTNCLPSAAPLDIYTEVSGTLAERIRLADDDDDARRWHRFFEVLGGVPRDLVKRPVMTLAYGVTLYSVNASVWEWYREAAKEHGRLDQVQNEEYRLVSWLSQALWGCMEERIVSAKQAMAWLRECSNTLVRNGVTVQWTAPSGLAVSSEYKKWSDNFGDNRMRVLEKVVRFRYRALTDVTNTRTTANSLCPNYVHSLDAACTVFILNRLTEGGVSSVSSIHDSYAVHPSEMGRLFSIVREVYAEVFSENLLERLRDEWQQALPDGVTLPDPPMVGGLDPQDVKQSDYFFS